MPVKSIVWTLKKKGGSSSDLGAQAVTHWYMAPGADAYLTDVFW